MSQSIQSWLSCHDIGSCQEVQNYSDDRVAVPMLIIWSGRNGRRCTAAQEWFISEFPLIHPRDRVQFRTWLYWGCLLLCLW